MAINLLALPQFQAPRSLLLDLAPINQALDYQQALKQQEFKNARAMAQDRRAAAAEDRDAQMAPLRQAQAQAAIDASRGSETRAQDMHSLNKLAKQTSIAATSAQLAQAKALTPDGRAAIAQRFGIDVNTPEGRGFVLNGTYTPQNLDTQKRRQQLIDAGLDPNDQRHKVFIASGKMPREDQSPLTATDKKAILEADEMVMTTQGVIQNLNDAVALSKKAYTGPTAGIRGYVGSIVGDEAGKATEDLNNLITQNALSQLKATFGSAPTEGERKILLEIQGSVNKAPAVREAIYKRAAALAENRLKFYRERADRMRGQTYYKPQDGNGQSAIGAPPQPAQQQQQTAPKRYKFNPATGALE